MRAHEIETWTLNIIDRVKARQAIEDSRVELKAKWPEDAGKAARQIAGHANAARGEPILWLIGIDEKSDIVPGADFKEFSSWYNAVKGNFDELAPEPVSINVPVGGVTVAAILFETDRAPFVVKNPSGGTIQREVPWREATGIQSATRSQLLRLLTPLQRLPILEVVGAFLVAEPWASQSGEMFLRWEMGTALFLTQPAGQQTVFPSHKCTIQFGVSGYDSVGPLSGITFRRSGSKSVDVAETGLSITGPGLFEVRYSISSKRVASQDMSSQDARIDLSLRPANIDHSIPVAMEMHPDPSSTSTRQRWGIGQHTFYA